MEKFARFDAADYLDSEEVIAEYLMAVLDEKIDVLMTAVADIIKARNMKHKNSQVSINDLSQKERLEEPSR